MKIKATLHCHGMWTDFATGRYDIEKFPRNIEAVADLAISKKLDLVGLTDISGKKYVCEIYRPLVEISNSKLNKYEITKQDSTSTIFMRKKDGRKTNFGRTIEILSNDSHVLVLGTDKNILGGRPLEDVLHESREHRATIVADHPCYTIRLGKGMGEEKVRKFRNLNLIDALEQNGNIVWLLEQIGHYNARAIELGRELNMPVIANCDGNSAKDMACMFTLYDIPNTENNYTEILKLIKNATFSDSRIKRAGKPKPFISLPLHVIRGFYSIYRAKKGWIKQGLPAC